MSWVAATPDPTTTATRRPVPVNSGQPLGGGRQGWVSASRVSSRHVHAGVVGHSIYASARTRSWNREAASR